MLYVGTSGWQYRDWKGNFYPEKLAQAGWLRFYSERFRVVEVNNTFYHLPEATTFARWERETPDDFVVAVKMSRYLTHLKRLLEPREPVRRFMSRARQLGTKLGPVLVQLPPRFEVEPERLRATLAEFDRDVRVAVEFRDGSWYTDEVREILEAHGAALVLADRRNRHTPLWRTADWGFVRLHEGVARPRPCYGERSLATWVERIAELWRPEADVFAFFNNDHRCCAVRDAAVFARLAERAGVDVTRTPEPREVALAGAGPDRTAFLRS
jgi:uncharacterized protein YecE (DUF72 family)